MENFVILNSLAMMTWCEENNNIILYINNPLAKWHFMGIDELTDSVNFREMCKHCNNTQVRKS